MPAHPSHNYLLASLVTGMGWQNKINELFRGNYRVNLSEFFHARICGIMGMFHSSKRENTRYLVIPSGIYPEESTSNPQAFAHNAPPRPSISLPPLILDGPCYSGDCHSRRECKPPQNRAASCLPLNHEHCVNDVLNDCCFLVCICLSILRVLSATRFKVPYSPIIHLHTLRSHDLLTFPLR